MESFKIYRGQNIVYEFELNINTSDSLQSDNYITTTIESKNEIDLKINDYILVSGIKYSIFKPIEMEESNGVYSYPVTFYAPYYLANFCIIEDEGATTFSYYGGVSDFMQLVIKALKKDYPEFSLGEIEENGIIDLAFDNSNCLEAIRTICEAAKMEFCFEGYVLNIKKRIGQETDYVFEYGKNKGGYSVKLSQVANASITTIMKGKGGTYNLPKDYVSPDNPKRLNLGNEVLEKNVDKYGKITGIYINENIYPRLINKTVQNVEVPVDTETAASWKIKLDIPFNLSDYYADNETPLIKFQTGDLTGNEFEIVENSWNNEEKTLSIVVQDNDGYRLPNKERQPKVGDVFVLLNIYMPYDPYVTDALAELRKATQDELNRKSVPQYAPTLVANRRYIKKNNINLNIGDGITVKIGSHSLATRIIGISESSSSNEINYELGDQILYSYDTKTNNTIEQIQATLKQLINIDDIKRLFYNLINAWYPKWFNQKLHKDADVEFNSVKATEIVKTERVTANNISSERFVSGPLGEGYRINENGEAEFQNLTVRGTFSAFELLIQQMRAIGGQFLISPASVKISIVEEIETGYKCSLNTENGTIPNPFVVNDQLIHQVFTGNSINRYWRLVTETGNDFFVLSKTECETGSGIPAADDEVMLLGNRTDANRQSAILISAYGSDTPFTAYYTGINNFSLSGKEVMREGNLNGIVDKDLGQLTGFGLYASNVYLKGVFRLVSGKTIESAISDSVQEGVNSIEIGGTNLLNNTEKTYVGAAGQWWGYDFNQTVSDWNPGDLYTLSAEGKVLGETVTGTQIFMRFRSDGSSDYNITFYSTEFVRKELTVTVPDFADVFEVRMRNVSSPVAGEIRKIKLETGNKATAWTPSVPDQQSQIDSAKNIANAAQQSVMQVTEQVTQLIADNEGIKASVTTVEEKVANTKVGGENIVSGTATFSGDVHENYAGFGILQAETFRGNAVYQAEYDWRGFYFDKERTEGPTIISVYARKISGAPRIHAIVASHAGDAADRYSMYIESTEWKQYFFYFPNGAHLQNDYKNGAMEFAGGFVQYSSPKVEFATVPSDWSPSLKDVQNSIRPGTVNYLNGSRLDNLTGWAGTGGSVTLVQDEKFGTVVEYSRPGGGGEYQKSFELPRNELTNTELVYYVIAKDIAGNGLWHFGGWQETFYKLSTPTANKIDLGNGWYQYWATFNSGESIGDAFGLNTISGTWRFYAAGVLKGNKPASWVPSLADQESEMQNKASAARDEANAYTDTKTPRIRHIDARGLDENKYYPVTIWVPPSVKTGLEVYNSLDGVKPSWAIHESGFSVICVWTTSGGGYGTARIQREITDYSYGWSDVPPCGSIGQMEHSNNEFIYVRGGGYYYFKISNESAGDPVLHTEAYTTIGETVNILDSVEIPVPALETVRVQLDSEIKVLKGLIDLAVSREEFDANDTSLRSDIGQIRVDYQSISATVENINNRLDTGDIAGMVTTSTFVNVFAQHINKLGESVIGSINVAPDNIKISAKNIDLNGAVTVNSTTGAQVVIQDGKLTAINAEISGRLISNNITITGGEFMGFELVNGWLTASHNNYSIFISAGYDNTEQSGNFSKALISLNSPVGHLYLNDPLNQGWMVKLQGHMQQYGGYIESEEIRVTTLKATNFTVSSISVENNNLHMYGLNYRDQSGESGANWKNLQININTGRIAFW